MRIIIESTDNGFILTAAGDECMYGTTKKVFTSSEDILAEIRAYMEKRNDS